MGKYKQRYLSEEVEYVAHGFDSRTCKSSIGKPLKSYSSLSDAQAASEYVRATYRSDMVPYKCPNCPYWHLSPADRVTPSHTSGICTGRDGQLKGAYPTEGDARRRAEYLAKEKGVTLGVYHCNVCGQWHLTSQRRK